MPKLISYSTGPLHISCGWGAIKSGLKNRFSSICSVSLIVTQGSYDGVRTRLSPYTLLKELRTPLGQSLLVQVIGICLFLGSYLRTLILCSKMERFKSLSPLMVAIFLSINVANIWVSMKRERNGKFWSGWSERKVALSKLWTRSRPGSCKARIIWAHSNKIHFSQVAVQDRVGVKTVFLFKWNNKIRGFLTFLELKLAKGMYLRNLNLSLRRTFSNCWGKIGSNLLVKAGRL